MHTAVRLNEEAAPVVTMTTTLIRSIEFVCPTCGGEQPGTLLDADDGEAHIECDTCRRVHDVRVGAVPTQAVVDEWRHEAIHQGRLALHNAWSVHQCTPFARVHFRRLAPELTTLGKARVLNDLVRWFDRPLSEAQLAIVHDLGRALGLRDAEITGLLAVS